MFGQCTDSGVYRGECASFGVYTPTKVAYLHTPNKFALCTANCCLANASDLALEPSILQR